MQKLLRNSLIVNPKYNVFYFLFCFGIYYTIGYLYKSNNLFLVKAAKLSETYFSPIVSIIPRFQIMFDYLSLVQNSNIIGVVNLAIIIMLLLLSITFIQIIFLKKETYEVGNETFFKVIEHMGWRKYIIVSILFIILYLIYLLNYFPDNYIFPYFQNKNIINSPFVLMLEMASHHFVLSFLGLLLYVVPFVYIPYKKSNVGSTR